MPRAGYVSLQGSHREPLPGARAVAPADPDEHVDVTVVVRRRTPHDGGAEAPHGRLSRRELAQAHGADPADLEAVARFADDHDLQVVERDAGRRRVVLSGTVGDLQRAFDVELARFEHEGGGTYRGRTGTIAVPASLKDVVVAVLGLDDRPQARAHSRILEEIDENAEDAAAAPRAGQSFEPPDLAKLYDFPAGTDGSGECIAIVELGGGFRKRDIRTYFSSLGLPTPTVVAVSVDGGRNRPTFPQSADGEVMLDIEAAAGVAPGARIAVYFAPNTDRGFADAVSQAVHDDGNAPSIISISWGAAESRWTPQAIDAMEAAFEDAASLGVTVYCAAGDNGSTDGERDGRAHVDFPASSPHVVGCGGTHLSASGGHISGETVWQANGATGGGVSDVFGVPSWQQSANVPPSANPPGTHRGRGVPDIAADADPATGYVIRVDGRTFVIGGTSAVAPLWAGLTALINQQLGGPIGFVNPALYEIGASAGAFGDITQGSNGAYSARSGWDPCTGWGSPRGARLLDALRARVEASPVQAT